MPLGPLPFSLPVPLYGMADASAGDPVKLGTWLFERGVKVVQLRAKAASGRERAELARTLVAVARTHGASLIVNDDLEATRVSGAHGVHLGQDDAPTAEARRWLGPGTWVGRSTHSLEQVRAADDADYLGFGPVFGTQTKDTGWSPRGVDLLAGAVAHAQVPVVAIGGIRPDNVAQVRGAGAAGWAVVGGLWSSPDRLAALEALLAPT